MRWRFAVVLAGLTLAGLASAEIKPDKDRKPAAEFRLTDAKGATVQLSALKGKVVLLNFWATWCGPCKQEIPWFGEFAAKYKAQGLEVVGVSMDDEGFAVVKPYITKNKVAYTIVIGNDDLSKKYGGIDGLPMSFLIDRNGKIAATYSGLVERPIYEKDLAAILKP